MEALHSQGIEPAQSIGDIKDKVHGLAQQVGQGAYGSGKGEGRP